jgi:hypothetical protein
MVDCEALQLDLPLYFDRTLSLDERDLIDAHLVQCPLCRQKLDEFRQLRNSLAEVARPRMPESLVASIRNTVSSKLAPVISAPGFHLLDAKRRWIDVWLVPYTVGGFASLIIGFAMLWAMVFATRQISTTDMAGANSRFSDSPVYLASAAPSLGALDISPGDYANSRMGFTRESPSLNPQGALVALTRSLVRGEMRDDEVVVVADVFGDGLASIAEVVEPSRDKKAVDELQKALQTDPSYAPFVPAEMDQRSNTVRVVLRLQSVNVKAR